MSCAWPLCLRDQSVGLSHIKESGSHDSGTGLFEVKGTRGIRTRNARAWGLRRLWSSPTSGGDDGWERARSSYTTFCDCVYVVQFQKSHIWRAGLGLGIGVCGVCGVGLYTVAHRGHAIFFLT